jgi:hypothetical protein
MKKYFIIIFILIYAMPSHSISSFSANYDLYLKNNIGNIKFGSAVYELIMTNNVYVFKSNAVTDKLWSTLYDYSINETSIGLMVGGKFIGDYYEIIENKGNLVSDKYRVNLYELTISDFFKSQLETLSDSELILKAIDSGNVEKIKFSGNQAKDNSIPSYKKDLKNREELIKVLLELDESSPSLVDALSLYLNISVDIQKFPNRKVFTYQFADKKGLSQREFTIIGFEKIKINDNDIQTIRIECPELDLTINVSKDYDFMPVYIRKTNGKTNFSLILSNFIHI